MTIILLAIAVTTGLFLGMAVILLVAERHLVNYGTCQVIVNGGEQRLSVQGGGNLLSALLENNITIPASCGGKGMCGYCKVRVTSGGGEVLPTELPFLSRRDIATGTRLACQVKIRQDVSVNVPDFLDVISDMVRSGTFDKQARWRFSIKGEEHEGF